MAAKHPANDPGLAPDINNGIDYRGKVAYDMDMGTPDKVFTCASCHSGGIMTFDRDTGKRHDEIEIWDDTKDGTGFYSKASYTDSEVDGDLFSYTPDEEARGYIGMPHKFNWKKSGVLDTDCLLCHSDRSLAEEENLVVKTTNGWSAANPTPANPRVFVFVKKDPTGKVVEISLGFPPQLTQDEAQKGYTIDSAAFYSDPLERLVAVYYGDVIQKVIGAELQNSGVDPSTLNQQQMMAIQSFTIGVITGYLKHGMTTGFTIPYSQLSQKIGVDLKDFTYNDSDFNNRLSGFFGQFYLDLGAPNFSARDYLRNAFYESTTEGQPYVGSGFFLRAASPQNNYTYKISDTDKTVPFVRLARAGHFFGWAATGTLMAIADPNDPSKPLAFVRLEKQKDGTFKAVAYYAEDADLDNVKLPILETDGHYTLIKPNPDTQTDGVSVSHQGDSDKDLSLMCAQCHFAVPDTENRWRDPYGNSYPSWYVRRGIIGLGADVVKRAAVCAPDEKQNDPSVAPIAITPDGEMPQYNSMQDAQNITQGLPVGYDVHMAKDGGNLSCLSCHGQDNLSEEEREHHNPHNFLKGNDPAGEVMPALDYNPSVRTCTSCHWGTDANAAKAHEAWFGPAAGAHISSIECQVCHIPYKTYWTFRFFDDSLGYVNQFDDRLMKFDKSTGTVNQFPPEWAIPAFGPTPTYGLNFSYVIAQTSDDGEDTVLPITSVDMDPYRALMRVGNSQFGLWEIKPGLFPWRWAPAIIKRWTIDDKGNPVLRAGLINPIQVFTWMDAATGRALFTREMNMAIDGVAYDSNGKPLGRSTIDPEDPDKSVPGLTIDPKTGKIAFKIHYIDGNPGGLPDYIDDDDGDMVPEISTDAEYEALKTALKQILDHEDPGHPHNPVIMTFMAPFGVDHGVLPAEYALGAQRTGPLSCNACHNPDESKNRLSPAVWEGDENAGREVTLTVRALPELAIKESKENHAWFLPEGTKIEDGKFVITQGALCRVTSVKVESKDYAAFFLVTPDGTVTGPNWNEITVAVQPGTVDTPTAIKVEKVEENSIEDSALSAAKSAGLGTPVLATEIYNIHTKTNSFNEPVTFTVRYDPSKVVNKVVVLASEDGKNWSVVTTTNVDPNNPFVSFARTKLSYFAVVGEAPSLNNFNIVLPKETISSNQGTAATLTVNLNGEEFKVDVQTENASIEGVAPEDTVKQIAEDKKIAKVLTQISVSPQADTFTITLSNLPTDAVTNATVATDRGTVTNISRDTENGTITATISTTTTRATEPVTVVVGEPLTAITPVETTTATVTGGGGGGCSIAPETAPASGIASFLTMLSGIAGLFIGRRKRRN